jgi:hypothetical protein
MPGQRRQRRGTGVPAEMVKLVARVGHDHLMHDLAVGLGLWIDIDHGQPVGLEPSGLSISVKASVSAGASIASFGVA